MAVDCVFLEERVLGVLVEALRGSGCDCATITGGIDTSTVALAARLAGLRLRGITVYYSAGLPRDLPYARLVAAALGIPLREVPVDDSYIASRAGLVAECTGRREYVEMRNDVVFLRAVEEARAMGCRCLLLGDGGDEVFAGYSFMLSLPGPELRETILRMATRGRYPGLELAECIGVEAAAPLLLDEVVEAVLQAPPGCLVWGPGQGKAPLRRILARHGLRLVAERPKTPAEQGAGTSRLARRELEEITGMRLGEHC
jgi:asparagine synthase (glutamine-hydrolysing)